MTLLSRVRGREPHAGYCCRDCRETLPGGQPLEDAHLIELARLGDVGAYERLVQRYQDLAFRTAYLITGESADAEDAAQEALVKAYYALPRFRRGAPFRPWLLRIVANEARNRRKAARRRDSRIVRATALAQAGDGTGPLGGEPRGGAGESPEDAALVAEERRLLLEAVDGLREEDRLVIAYRYFLDLSEEEMAVALGCPRGTVKSRLSRSLQRLRDEVLRRLGAETTGIDTTGERSDG